MIIWSAFDINEQVRLDVELDIEEIRSALVDLIATSGLKSAYTSMVASWHPNYSRNTRPKVLQNPFMLGLFHSFGSFHKSAKRGAHISITKETMRISAQSVDPVKNYHWGDMTAALFQALDDGYDTVLLDQGGHIMRPGFNIFAVIDGKVVTPKSGALEGITRKTVFEVCGELQIPVRQPIFLRWHFRMLTKYSQRQLLR